MPYGFTFKLYMYLSFQFWRSYQLLDNILYADRSIRHQHYINIPLSFFPHSQTCISQKTKIHVHITVTEMSWHAFRAFRFMVWNKLTLKGYWILWSNSCHSIFVACTNVSIHNNANSSSICLFIFIFLILKCTIK